MGLKSPMFTLQNICKQIVIPFNLEFKCIWCTFYGLIIKLFAAFAIWTVQFRCIGQTINTILFQSVLSWKVFTCASVKQKSCTYSGIWLCNNAFEELHG